MDTATLAMLLLAQVAASVPSDILASTSLIEPLTVSQMAVLRNDNHDSPPIKRRLAVHEYDAACTDFSLLYDEANLKDNLLFGGELSQVECACDPFTSDEYNLIVCQFSPVSCDPRYHLCIGERDVWIFDATTGQLEERATCFDCFDDAELVATLPSLDHNKTVEACAKWQDTCFLAQYKNHNNGVDDGDAEDDMTSCALVQIEINATCGNCQPCTEVDEEDGTVRPGMVFNCYPWDSEGECVTGSRLGHHPWDVVDPLVDGTSEQKNDKSIQADDEDTNTALLAVIVAAVVAIVFCCGLAAGLYIMKKNKGQQEPSEVPAAQPGVGYPNTDNEMTTGGFADMHDINITNKMDASETEQDVSYSANL